jgi:hypothetical protein
MKGISRETELEGEGSLRECGRMCLGSSSCQNSSGTLVAHGRVGCFFESI